MATAALLTYVKAFRQVRFRILTKTMALSINQGNPMKALTDLFTTDYGLMSIIGILMMIIGTVGAAVIIKRKMNEEPAPPPGSK